MNELQMGLLAIGGVVVLAVVIFNRWQERKFRRQAEQSFQNRHDDVLLSASESSRQEPVLDEGDLPLPDQDEALDENEPRIAADADALADSALTDTVEALGSGTVEEAVSASPPAMAAAVEAPVSENGPDLRIEYVALLEASEPFTAKVFQSIVAEIPPVGKPVRWLGQAGDSTLWEDAATAKPEQKWLRLAACLQLADRNGPLLKEQLDAFCIAAQAMAANLYAVVDCPDKQAILERALALDQFCAEVDVMIGVNLVSAEGAPFPGTKLRGLAEAAGMRMQDDGQFHFVDENGCELFLLSNLESQMFDAEEMKHMATHGVNFVLDVPKAAGGLQAFNQMILTANQFVAPLGARMVDDNRRDLTPAGLDRIRQQLTGIYDTMARHQIEPGSPATRRLFG